MPDNNYVDVFPDAIPELPVDEVVIETVNPLEIHQFRATVANPTHCFCRAPLSHARHWHYLMHDDNSQCVCDLPDDAEQHVKPVPEVVDQTALVQATFIRGLWPRLEEWGKSQGVLPFDLAESPDYYLALFADHVSDGTIIL